jgi:hypothetical protein
VVKQQISLAAQNLLDAKRGQIEVIALHPLVL